MTLQSLFIMLPSVISGGILAHFIWPDREVKSILLKLFLGIGVGLGINSILFFIFLLIFNRRGGFVGLQIFVMIVLIAMFILRERPFRATLPAFKLPGLKQMIFLTLTGAMLILA